ENILVELGAKELSVKRHGRKEVMLDINKNFAYAMGVVVINNIFQIAIVNLKCEILVKKTYSFEPPVSYYDFLDQLKDYMRELIWQNNLSKDKIIGIGFSMPGYLDSSDKGIVYDSFGIWKERNVPVEKILEEYFSIKVYLDNYNKNLALAEFMGRELDNVMFLDYTDTVELSIWTKDEVYKGANNYSGMVGHMIVDYNSSKICPICGNRGCLSTIISNFAVQRAIAQNFMNGELPELYKKYDGRLKKVTLYDVFLLHDKYSFINNIM
ncbi:MAG: ROK family protein, partial [Mycoplasma sp.]|nr:ROK family protein [Mycoplasma sp.]